MLEIAGLKHSYGKTRVLDVPKWRLENGQHALLLGPSGSGKTTLLHSIAGILKPASGHIKIDGSDIAAMPEIMLDRFRGRHIGLVFQTFHLIAALTALENLLLSQYVAGGRQDKHHCTRLLAELGVDNAASAYPRQLSHGQAQRVAIARALVNKPSLILADEPTSALDDGNCELVIDLLLKEAEQHGASLIVASHDSRLQPYFKQTLEMRAL